MKNSELERIKKEVIIETNRIRRNPKWYIPLLEKYLENFDGNVLTIPEKEECIETQEGPSAYKEAIEFLKNQKPVSELEYDEEISNISLDYAKTINNNGELESDNAIENRLAKYLDWDYAVSESIDYGGTSGKEVIVNLLVDDGVKLRTHRENIFNQNFLYFGVAVVPNEEYEFCTVIDYFGDIVSFKDEKKNKIFQDKKNKKKLEKEQFSNLSSAKGNSEFNECEEINVNGNDFNNDPDAPEGCVKKITKNYVKKYHDKTVTTTVKIYLIEDGSEETVTIEETVFDI